MRNYSLVSHALASAGTLFLGTFSGLLPGTLLAGAGLLLALGIQKRCQADAGHGIDLGLYL